MTTPFKVHGVELTTRIPKGLAAAQGTDDLYSFIYHLMSENRSCGELDNQFRTWGADIQRPMPPRCHQRQVGTPRELYEPKETVVEPLVLAVFDNFTNWVLRKHYNQFPDVLRDLNELYLHRISEGTRLECHQSFIGTLVDYSRLQQRLVSFVKEEAALFSGTPGIKRVAYHINPREKFWLLCRGTHQQVHDQLVKERGDVPFYTQEIGGFMPASESIGGGIYMTPDGDTLTKPFDYYVNLQGFESFTSRVISTQRQRKLNLLLDA